MTEWRALHVHYSIPEMADEIILKADALIRERGKEGPGTSRNWFFIRYFDGGAHVRIRVRRGLIELFDNLQSELSDLLQARGADQMTDWYESMSHAFEEDEVFPPGSVIERPYVPETLRYGGPACLAVNEDVFCESSALVCQILSKTSQMTAEAAATMRTKLAADLTLMNTAIIHSSPDDARDFLEQYGIGWAKSMSSDPEQWREIIWPSYDQKIDACRMLQEYRRFLESAEPPKNVVQLWGRHISNAAMEFRNLAKQQQLFSPVTGQASIEDAEIKASIEGIISSQIHMLNNRLAQYPVTEANIAYFLFRSLRAGLAGAEHIA